MLCPERGNRYTLKGKIGMKMTQTLDHLSPLDPFCITLCALHFS